MICIVEHVIMIMVCGLRHKSIMSWYPDDKYIDKKPSTSQQIYPLVATSSLSLSLLNNRRSSYTPVSQYYKLHVSSQRKLPLFSPLYLFIYFFFFPPLPPGGAFLFPAFSAAAATVGAVSSISFASYTGAFLTFSSSPSTKNKE